MAEFDQTVMHSGGGALVVLVEDDPSDADLVRLALRRAGRAETVLWCASANEALDALARRGAYASRPPLRPAVILMDLKMPGMNGIEALRALRADTGRAPAPVVMFTSSNDPTDVAQAYAAGASSYVVKPVDSGAYNDVVALMTRYWVDCNVGV